MSQRAQRTSALPIGEQYTEENIKCSKGILFKRQRVFNQFFTSDSYKDSLIFDARLFSKVLIHIKEIGGSYSIYYQIWVCIDPTIWELLKEDILGAKLTRIETLTDAWSYVKIAVKSYTAGNPAKVNAFIGGKTP